jgi:hypothetical protein
MQAHLKRAKQSMAAQWLLRVEPVALEQRSTE